MRRSPLYLYRSASVSSLSTSSGPKKSASLDLSSLLNAMTEKSKQDEATMYNNNITITAEECDLYAGSFFSPSRPQNSPHVGPASDLFAGTDPYKQFIRFEQSVFKLDRLLNMRHFNKLNSMPDRDQVPTTRSAPSSANLPPASNTKIPVDELEDWLGNVISTDPGKRAIDGYKERKREEIGRMRISDVLKRAMVVGFKSAEVIEQEVQEAIARTIKDKEQTAEPKERSAQNGDDSTTDATTVEKKSRNQMMKQVESTCSSTRPIPIFDVDSLCLLSPKQLVYLLETFGLIEFPLKNYTQGNLVKSWLSVTVRKLQQFIEKGAVEIDDGMPVKMVSMLSGTRKLADLVRIIQNKEKEEIVCEENKPDPLTFAWTPEIDASLVGYVQAFLRRRDQANTAFEEWKSEYGPVLPERLENLPAPTVWGLVARELSRSVGQKVTRNACRLRYISLQRSSL